MSEFVKVKGVWDFSGRLLKNVPNMTHVSAAQLAVTEEYIHILFGQAQMPFDQSNGEDVPIVPVFYAVMSYEQFVAIVRSFNQVIADQEDASEDVHFPTPADIQH